MTWNRIDLLGAPSSAGARRRGQEEAPAALRAAGLVAALAARGLAVTDLGDVERAVFRPDTDHPRAQNRRLVARVVRSVAAAVEAASGDGALPLVLGGDCTVTLGVVAGLVRRAPDLGLLYVDGDLDLNTPATTPSGIFDGMVTAHLLGRGEPELARFGPRHPLLAESHLAFFGYDATSGAVDPPELDALAASSTPRFPAERVRAAPLAVAEEALAALSTRADRILVHFDVDVTDTPAVDVPHPGGLSLETALAILGVLLASPQLAGLVVTEHNPRLDPAGVEARRLAAGLAAALPARC
jgi:arginase